MKDLLQKTNTTVTIKFHRCGYHFNSDYKDNTYRDIYQVTVKRNGIIWTFDYGNSIYNMQKHIQPTVTDVMTCVTTDDPGTFEDFCRDYEYDKDENMVYDTYKNVKQEYKNWWYMFRDVMEAYNDIVVNS